MHISCTLEAPKCQNDLQNVTLDEAAVLNLIRNEPLITQKKIALSISKSSRTVKRTIDSLKEKGIVSREGGKRFGYWKVNV